MVTPRLCTRGTHTVIYSEPYGGGIEGGFHFQMGAINFERRF